MKEILQLGGKKKRTEPHRHRGSPFSLLEVAS